MEDTKKIKVIIVDDQPTVRDGYKANLQDENLQKEFNVQIEILGDFPDDISLFNYLNDDRKTKPDIILLDMQFKNRGEPLGGIRITKEIKRKFRDSIDIIIVSGEFDYPATSSSYVKEKDIKKMIEENSKVIADAIDAGARGFVSRNVEKYSSENLFRALRAISRREEYFFNAPVLRIIIAAFLQYVRQETFVEPHERAKFFHLDDIDLTHLNMMATGKAAKEIAVDLAKAFERKEDYSIQAITQRQERIADKLGVYNNSNLILMKAVKECLIAVNLIDI